MNDPKLGTLVTFNPASVALETPLAALAEKLLVSGFHHWPVVDADRRVVGIISDADIVRHYSAFAAAQGARERPGPVASKVTARDILSPRVATIELSTSWQAALTTLVDQKVHSLPVVDRGMLVGIVTSSDFLRELSHGQLPGSRESVAAHMTKTAETIEADADLDTARFVMLGSGHTYLAIVKGECPLGVISRRTLRKARCAQLLREAMGGAEQSRATLVRELIRSAPTVKPGDRLASAAQLMVDFGVQAVAVVNQGHRLLGVLSEDDLLRAILAEESQAATGGRDARAPGGYFRACSK